MVLNNMGKGTDTMEKRDLNKSFFSSASQTFPSSPIPPTQSILPLSFSVPSSNPKSVTRYVVLWDGKQWCCTCEHYRRTGTDCRHILEKRLETKENGHRSVFSGVTVEPLVDEVRLCKQYKRVFSCMVDGEWRTLSEIALVTGDPQASISARLRDFRKRRFGAHQVDRRRKGDDTCGLFEYRLVPNEKVRINVE